MPVRHKSDSHTAPRTSRSCAANTLRMNGVISSRAEGDLHGADSKSIRTRRVNHRPRVHPQSSHVSFTLRDTVDEGFPVMYSRLNTFSV